MLIKNGESLLMLVTIIPCLRTAFIVVSEIVIDRKT